MEITTTLVNGEKWINESGFEITTTAQGIGFELWSESGILLGQRFEREARTWLQGNGFTRA